MTPSYKNGWKKDPGKDSPVNMTSVPWKVMEWITFNTITKHPGQTGDQAQLARVSENQVLLVQPDLLL